MNRRDFLTDAAIAAAGLVLTAKTSAQTSEKAAFVSNRPALKDRKFVSKAVEAKIAEVKSAIRDPELAWLFENCYPNTLDTTVELGTRDGKPDSFVITGDLKALWLRDSTAQVTPYLSLVKDDRDLQLLIKGLIHRHAYSILLEPYANAFLKDPNEKGWDDLPKNKPGVLERKWEVDSLCYSMRLAYQYWRATNDASAFDDEWQSAMRLIIKTFKKEQLKEGKSDYYLLRKTDNMIDAPPFYGTGSPVRPCGLIRSAFRPSDDSTLFQFLIPSNAFAVVSLRHLAEIFRTALKNEEFARECEALATEVERAIYKYAVVEHENFGKIFAYEVDGYGNRLFIDDANAPNLISLPYLGFVRQTDPIYQNTRRFVLSDNNPYFRRGKFAEAVGSPHTGKTSVWHLSIVMRGLTSSDDAEIRRCLAMLKRTHAGTGFMHESFNPDDPTDFTRKWFAWANTIFGELILKIFNERKRLLAELTF
ncbi:MAG: glycoside hydrolase family 125 protein [Acidobacteria bacterium]|nr:glycoside hydrolase family 125 protein [Acidobacteriota bacterium]